MQHTSKSLKNEASYKKNYLHPTFSMINTLYINSTFFCAICCCDILTVATTSGVDLSPFQLEILKQAHVVYLTRAARKGHNSWKQKMARINKSAFAKWKLFITTNELHTYSWIILSSRRKNQHWIWINLYFDKNYILNISCVKMISLRLFLSKN